MNEDSAYLSTASTVIASLAMVGFALVLVALYYIIVKKIRAASWRWAAIGVVSGGASIPFVLFLVCAGFGDTGGPLIWPMLSLFLAFLLGLSGAIFGAFKSKPNQLPDPAPTSGVAHH